MTETISAESPPQRLPHNWWWLPFLIGIIGVLLLANFRDWPDTIKSRDLNQHRANSAAAIPTGDLTLSQTFIPQRDGLSEIEVIFVRNDFPLNEDVGSITLSLLADGETVASEKLLTRDLTHNQFYTLKFDPVVDSAEMPFTLHISGTDNQAITVWGYDLETISHGELTTSDPAAATTAKDLRLITHYQLTSRVALRLLGTQIKQYGTTIGVTLLVLFMPGVLLWQIAHAFGKQLSTGDKATDHAIMLVLGVAIWPILWLWVTVLGGRFGRISLTLLLILGYTLTLFLRHYFPPQLRHRRFANRIGRGDQFNNSTTSPLRHSATSPPRHPAAPYLLPLAALLPRLLAIRDLAFPAWVDSSRHALMTAVMHDSGQFLRNYAPYLNAEAGLYHYGYHALAATVGLIGGFDLPQVLLLSGQLFNALLPFTIYAGTYLLTKQRRAGLLAGFLIAFPSFFPAYYVSWGRLTQLTGMLILPILVGYTFRLTVQRYKPKNVSENHHVAKPDTRTLEGSLLITALLTGGLFLVHFRVLLIFLPLAILLWGLYAWFAPWQLPLAGLGGGLLVLPRIVEMYQRLSTSIKVNGGSVLSTKSGYNDFPTGYVTIGWEKWILVVAVGAIALALLYLLQRFRWMRWLGAVGLLVYIGAGEWLGTQPALGLPWLRTGLAIVICVVMIKGWRQMRVQWPVPLLLWLAFAPLAQTWQQAAIGLMVLWVMVWIVPQVAVSAENNPFRTILLLTLWVALLFATLLGSRIGLPESWVLNLNSMYISLFLPIALVIGIASDTLWQWLEKRHWLAQGGGYLLIGGLLGVLFLYGLHTQLTILNPATVLAERPDRAGIDWIAQKTPRNAKIAVNSWKWLNNTWAAQDGGAWITPLTQRMTTTPPVDYVYNRDLATQVRAFNEAAVAIEDWSSDEAITFLQENDITYIYIGARGGYLKPDIVNRHPDTSLLFAQDGVFIFAVRPK